MSRKKNAHKTLSFPPGQVKKENVGRSMVRKLKSDILKADDVAFN